MADGGNRTRGKELKSHGCCDSTLLLWCSLPSFSKIVGFNSLWYVVIIVCSGINPWQNVATAEICSSVSQARECRNHPLPTFLLRIRVISCLHCGHEHHSMLASESAGSCKRSRIGVRECACVCMSDRKAHAKEIRKWNLVQMAIGTRTEQQSKGVLPAETRTSCAWAGTLHHIF